MDLSLLQSIVTIPFLFLMIACGFLCTGIKKGLEKLAVKVAFYSPDKFDAITSWVWREFTLPILPIIIGLVIGLTIKDYPVPEELPGKARLIYFMSAGLISSWIYPRIQYFIKKIPKGSNGESLVPPSK